MARVTVYGDFAELPTMVLESDPEWIGDAGKQQALARAIDHLIGVRDRLFPPPEDVGERTEQGEGGEDDTAGRG